jgi:hypothetical protein
MDDRETTTPDDPGIESTTSSPPGDGAPTPDVPTRDIWSSGPAAPPALEPPMLAPFPPPPLTTPTPSSSKRRFPWVTVVVGVVAVAAIVALTFLFVSTSSEKNDAEDALADARSDLAQAQSRLADSEAARSESEAALATAHSDLSDKEAALADAETARAEAEGTRDRHQQLVDDYETASADFLAATIVAGLSLDEHVARCVANGIVDSLGPEAMAILASAALDGSGDVVKLDDEMRRAGETCGVPPETFDEQFDSANSDANAYGDDPELDALYDDCAAGDATACDDLYTVSAPGSEYEQFGGTCGDRFEFSATEPCDGRF